ncbi:amidohydrolase [Alkalicoccus daliensis]|uniref:5-methylthioadenosine/S-adenosylhomocysteine deaminase n=1 Tax=Alkalicoccus daliensis TaxID=745820 RepID=A0A1H0ASV9_9BACI|nr:amidohydrolase [Alkalicoccus daliensis]SDN36461.1 5-methylthioadenosine/S-adenosylhomocysteine deaminase [Alkalicoccus daliensis]
MKILKNVVIVNPGEKPYKGFVTIEKDKFISVSPGDPKSQGIPEEDGCGGWLLPGLVNTHGHAGSSILRGAGDDMALDTWLKTVMWPNESKFTEETVKAATNLAMAEMIKSGTTTFLDMYHLFVDQFAERIADTGLKAVLGRGMIAFGTEEEKQSRLEASKHLIQQFHGSADGRLHIAVTPHAPYTCPPEFMLKAVELALDKNVLFHTHCAETKKEVEEHYSTYGIHPVDHLHKLGAYSGKSLLAHAVHVTEAHIDLFAAHKVSISHNPMSNLKLGSGIAPVAEMIKRKVNVSIGTDSTASNNSLDMVEEMRMAALLPKGRQEDPTVTNADQSFSAATVGGARALHLNKTGMLKPGWFADMILIDPKGLHLQPQSLEKIKSHILYAMKSSDIQSVWIHGKQLLKNRELTTLDEEKIIYEANIQAQKLR